MAHSRWKFVPFLFLLSVYAQNTSIIDDLSYDSDPILKYRPPFARSLPVQILMTGIVLTLVSVLFIHLIFTAQYHWALAQVNYVLQISGVSTLLISLVATLHVVLNATQDESRQWPYMLSYIAVNVPPELSYEGSWSTAEWATWLVMNATTSALIQITHIQFLTLLYPSRLETRLIFFTLAPLAIVAAVMQLIPLQGDVTIATIASAVRNVCNATLSLLFTLALLLWGFLVNRTRAWRTDGGTSTFGAGAIALALVSTALNFMYIPSEEEYVWMPGLMWAVVLWQSFLGWWWWVGAGMGVGEVEELIKKQEKKERRKRKRQERREEQREKAKAVWRGVTGAFGKRPPPIAVSPTSNPDVEDEGDTPTIASAPSSSMTSSSFPTVFAQTRVGRLLDRWFRLLRQAHLAAIRKQAVERVERVRAAYGREAEVAGIVGSGGAGVGVGMSAGMGDYSTDEDPRTHDGTVAAEAAVGWGLGSFGIRELERAAGAGPYDLGAAVTPGAGMPSNHTGRGRRDASVVGGIDLDDMDKTHRRRREKTFKSAAEGTEWEDMQEEEETEAGRGWWWWGPLRRWRLKDLTVYS